MIRTTAALLATALLSMASSVAAGTLTGRVSTSSGKALEQARVEAVEQGAQAFTDRRGAFTLEGVEAPLLLLITHPRFEDGVVSLETLPVRPLDIRLQPKQEIFEEIVVSASLGGDSFSPVSMDSTVIVPTEEAPAPSTLTEALIEVPGVSENGQGGRFQVFSVRGVSKNRVLPLISGMRVVTERRAGAAVSFLDPMLMGEVDVVRGPVSTWYGSGALGGVVQIFPRTFTGVSAAVGYASQGNENYQMGAWGGQGWSLGLVRRSAGRGEDGAGNELFDAYDQVSATLGKTWVAGGKTFEILALGAFGRDIEKPNTQVPERTTVYPEENHLFLKFAITSENGWRLAAYVHPNDLSTDALRVGRSLNQVDNSAFDYGFNWQKESSLARRIEARYGLEYFGRRDVTATEVDTDLRAGGPPTVLETLDGAEEDELAAYGALHFRLGAATLETGGRFTWQRQENVGFAEANDTAWTGFVGLSVPVAKNLELAANVGTGLRFPSLSERFFSGTTGRGGVIGNPDLNPERSLSTDLGFSYYGKTVFVSSYIFRNEIDDYIERIDIEPGLRTFVNLTSGTIEGFEIEGFYQPNPEWRISLGGAVMDGEAADGSNLADVPPAQIRLGLRFTQGPWKVDARYLHRFEKDDPGSGELAIPEANLISASLSYRLAPGWSLSLSGKNLLDEEYFPSADDVASLAPGRSIGLGLSWEGNKGEGNNGEGTPDG